MRKVSIYIEETRESNNYSELELFKDEEININLSVQNVKDISKVFTDFTQSFTVPASSVNNSLLRHYYENAVDLDLAEWDNRLRINAYIEINRIPFRNGKIEIEKANIVKGRVESYTITFYGNLVNLKELIGDALLSELDLSNISNPYSYSDVKERVFNYTTDYDVRYPLITSDRIWTYGDSTSTDVSINGGAINYTELFPAVKVAKILESIENTYGVTFSGLFLTDKRFTDLFLWCKNSESKSNTLQNQKIDFFSKSGDTNVFNLDLNTDIISIRGASLTNLNRLVLNLGVVSISSTTIPFTVEVYDKDVLLKTITRTGAASFNVIEEWITSTTEKDISLRVRSDATIDIQFSLDYKLFEWFDGTTQIAEQESADAKQLSVTNTVDLSLLMPEIKVTDFLSGVLNQFNLTLTPTSYNSFQLEPLEWWYQKGAVVDITNYVDESSVDIKKVPLYKRLSFEHEQSQSVLNRGFLAENRVEYGDFSRSFSYNGDEFSIKLPFENLLFQKFTGTDLAVAYSLKEKDYTTYTPKPTLLYMYENKAVNGSGLKMTDGIGTFDTSTTYMPFGQDVYYNNKLYSLNFSVETSPLLSTVIERTTYDTYYRPYIENLFSYKNRLVSVKAIFPLSLITGLKLNDRLIIRDKRYTINDIATNLTTGEVQLELLNDFRKVANDSPEVFDGTVTSVELPVLPLNEATTVSLSTTTPGVTFSQTSFEIESYVTITIPTNPTTRTDLISEDALYDVISEDGFEIINEAADFNVIPIEYIHTLQNGDGEVYYTYIVQEI